MINTYETMLLISQAVKSNLSLSEAIRLSVMDGVRGSACTAALRRFADELDKGLDIPAAARKAGLPRNMVQMLDAAQKSGDFPDYLAELTDAEKARTKTIRTLAQLSAYPLFLLLVMTLTLFLGVFIAPQFEIIFRDFGT